MKLTRRRFDMDLDSQVMTVDEIKTIIDAAPLEEQVLLSAYLHHKFSTDSAMPLAEKLAAALKRIEAGQFVTLEKVVDLRQKLNSWGY